MFAQQELGSRCPMTKGANVSDERTASEKRVPQVDRMWQNRLDYLVHQEIQTCIKEEEALWDAREARINELYQAKIRQHEESREAQRAKRIAAILEKEEEDLAFKAELRFRIYLQCRYGHPDEIAKMHEYFRQRQANPSQEGNYKEIQWSPLMRPTALAKQIMEYFRDGVYSKNSDYTQIEWSLQKTPGTEMAQNDTLACGTLGERTVCLKSCSPSALEELKEILRMIGRLENGSTCVRGVQTNPVTPSVDELAESSEQDADRETKDQQGKEQKEDNQCDANEKAFAGSAEGSSNDRTDIPIKKAVDPRVLEAIVEWYSQKSGAPDDVPAESLTHAPTREQTPEDHQRQKEKEATEARAEIAAQTADSAMEKKTAQEIPSPQKESKDECRKKNQHFGLRRSMLYSLREI